MAQEETDNWRGATELNNYSDDDDSWDDEESFATPGVSSDNMTSGTLDGTKEYLRKERIQEMITTEDEYVKDLEALLEIADRRTIIVQPHTLIGNTEKVVEVARELHQGLEEANRGTGKEQQLGRLFLKYTDRLIQVYQEYCSCYSVRVLPLLKKYEESDEAREELNQLTDDLRSLRPNINSLNSALIKPVQRILRYPLYLNHLLEDTPSTHPDYPLLQEARTRLCTAAMQINEYTRGLGLVVKYRSEVDHSLHAKMRRVSLHSLAKKSVRMSTRLTQRLGITNQTACIELKEEEEKFHSIQRAAVALVDHATALLEAVRTRHMSELLVSAALGDVLQASYIETTKQATRESYDKALKTFDTAVADRVLRPAGELKTLCENPARLIQKYHHKKLDYDASLHKPSIRDEVHNNDKQEEKQPKVKVYEALHSLLLTELPVLNLHGQEVVVAALHSLASARLYLQGRMAQIYLRLLQDDTFTYTDPKAAQARAQQQMEWLIELLPHSLQKKYGVKDHHGIVIRRTKSKPNRNKRMSLPVEYIKGMATTIYAAAHPPTFYTDDAEAERGLQGINTIQEHRSTLSPEMVAHDSDSISSTETFTSLKRSNTVNGTDFWVVNGGAEKTLSVKPEEGSVESEEVQRFKIAHQPLSTQLPQNLEDAEVEEETQTYTALYNFTAEDETQLSIQPGQQVVPLLKDGTVGWWFVKTKSGEQGYVPATYLALQSFKGTD